MHALTIIRLYLGLSIVALSKKANASYADTWEAESLEPYGRIGRYRRIAAALNIPLEVILKNDISKIPLSYFDEHAPQEYLPVPAGKTAALGRAGEDLIFEREQKRLSKILPVHAKLVLPFYKMKGQRLGCDILSFDDTGKPLFLEVKCSEKVRTTISLTKNEFESAEKLSASEGIYSVVAINNWGKPEQTIQDIPYQTLLKTHDVSPAVYHCTPKKGPVTGFAYYRKLRGITEQEVAEALHIRQGKWSLYETGEREPPVKILIKASDFLDTSVDQLLAEYDISNA